MKTYHNFKDIASFQKFLRGGDYPKCHEKIGCLDYVKVGGILYTMHEYDIGGRYVNWANKKHNLMIQMDTANRYQTGYGDAQVEQFEAYYLRDDISYAQ